MTHTQTQGADGAGTMTAGRDPIATAPVNEEVFVYCGEMRFRAKLVPGASMTMDEEPCDQWQATIEGEHPPCWSDGCCWASNEDENASLQPTHWSPIAPAPAATPGVPDSVRALSEAASPDWDTNEATPYILGPPIDGEIDRFEVIARGPHGHAKSGDAIRKWQANRMFAVAAVNFVRTLIAAQPAGQAGDAGADARTVLTEACKPWEHYTGEPPDDGSPLSGVFVAGMSHTERLLAKLLDVTHYEGGDGSEDFDNDATQTLRNILTGAGLWDADENRAVKPAPDSTRTGAAESDDLSDRLRREIGEIRTMAADPENKAAFCELTVVADNLEALLPAADQEGAR